MDHVQIRVDDMVAKRPTGDGPRAVIVQMALFWPVTATREEVQTSLSTACENALADYDRKTRVTA